MIGQVCSRTLSRKWVWDATVYDHLWLHALPRHHPALDFAPGCRTRGHSGWLPSRWDYSDSLFSSEMFSEAVSFQAIKGILCKIPSVDQDRRVQARWAGGQRCASVPGRHGRGRHPVHWARPFVIKSYEGFYSWLGIQILSFMLFKWILANLWRDDAR